MSGSKTSPPSSAQMAPTGLLEKGVRGPESGRRSAQTPFGRSATTAAAIGRDDHHDHSREECSRSRPREGDVGCRRASGAGTEIEWCRGGGGGGGGKRRRRKGSRQGSAAERRAATTMRVLLLALAVLCCARCSPGLVPGAHAELRPEVDLTSNCFDFPERNFDRSSSIMAVNGGHTPYLPLETGSGAIDFTLHDLQGRPWNLRHTLEQGGQPVVMIFGMWTCPAFQGYGTTPPWDMSSYWDERELVEAYKNKAVFVHIYGPEPHPSTPGTNFDKGIPWQSYWSVLRQPETFEERVATAEKIVDKIHTDQRILVDYLPGNPYSELIQPVWCSYAMGARPVTVITPDGNIFFQRGWFHAKHVAGAIDGYYCLQEEEQRQHQQLQEGQTDDEPSASSGCFSSDGGGGGDMGDDGISPLAGVLPGTGSVASLPPWLG
eukprot:g3405.t1